MGSGGGGFFSPHQMKSPLSTLSIELEDIFTLLLSWLAHPPPSVEAGVRALRVANVGFRAMDSLWTSSELTY